MSGSTSTAASAEPLCSAADAWVIGRFTGVMSDSFSPTLSSASQQDRLAGGALLEGDLLALQVLPPLDVVIAGGGDEPVRTVGGRPPGHRGDVLVRRLGEDQRACCPRSRLSIEPRLERLEHRRTTDEGGVLHLVREVLVLAGELQDGLEVVELVTDPQRGAGRDLRRLRGRRRLGARRSDACARRRRSRARATVGPRGTACGVGVIGRSSFVGFLEMRSGSSTLASVILTLQVRFVKNNARVGSVPRRDRHSRGPPHRRRHRHRGGQLLVDPARHPARRRHRPRRHPRRGRPLVARLHRRRAGGVASRRRGPVGGRRRRRRHGSQRHGSGSSIRSTAPASSARRVAPTGRCTWRCAIDGQIEAAAVALPARGLTLNASPASTLTAPIRRTAAPRREPHPPARDRGAAGRTPRR